MISLLRQALPLTSSIHGGLQHWCQLLCDLATVGTLGRGDDETLTAAHGGDTEPISSLAGAADPLLLCEPLADSILRLFHQSGEWRRLYDGVSRRIHFRIATSIAATPQDGGEVLEAVLSSITSALMIVLPAVYGGYDRTGPTNSPSSTMPVVPLVVRCRSMLALLCDVAATFPTELPNSTLHVSRCVMVASLKGHIIAQLGEQSQVEKLGDQGDGSDSTPAAAQVDFLKSFLRMVHACVVHPDVFTHTTSVGAITEANNLDPHKDANASYVAEKISSCVPWIAGALSNLLDVDANSSRVLMLLEEGWYVSVNAAATTHSPPWSGSASPSSVSPSGSPRVESALVEDDHSATTNFSKVSIVRRRQLLPELMSSLGAACDGGNATRWFFSVLAKLSKLLAPSSTASLSATVSEAEMRWVVVSQVGFLFAPLRHQVCRLLTTQLVGPEGLSAACRWIVTMCDIVQGGGGVSNASTPFCFSEQDVSRGAQPIYAADLVHALCVSTRHIMSHRDSAVAVLEALAALFRTRHGSAARVQTAACTIAIAEVTTEVRDTVLALAPLCATHRAREALRRTLFSLCLSPAGTAVTFDCPESVAVFRDAMLQVFSWSQSNDEASSNDAMDSADVLNACDAFAALASYCPDDALLQDDRWSVMWVALCQRLTIEIDSLQSASNNNHPAEAVRRDDAARSLMVCLESLCRRSVRLTHLILGSDSSTATTTTATGDGVLHSLLTALFPWMTSHTAAAACKAIEAAASEPSARRALSTSSYVTLFSKILAPVAATATGADTCVAWACAVNRITLHSSPVFADAVTHARGSEGATAKAKVSSARHGSIDDGDDDDAIVSRFAVLAMHDAILILSAPLCCYHEDSTSVMWKCSVLIHLTASDNHVSVFWSAQLRNWLLVYAMPTLAAALTAVTPHGRQDGTNDIIGEARLPESSPTTRWALSKSFSSAHLSRAPLPAALPLFIEPVRWLCGAVANLTLREEGRRLYLGAVPVNIFAQLLPLAAGVSASPEATRWMLAVLCNLTAWSPITTNALHLHRHDDSARESIIKDDTLREDYHYAVPTMLRFCSTAIVDEGAARLLCVAYKQVFSALETLGGYSSNVSLPGRKLQPPPTFSLDGQLESLAAAEYDVVALCRMVPLVTTPTVAADLFQALLALPMPHISQRRCRVLRIAEVNVATALAPERLAAAAAVNNDRSMLNTTSHGVPAAYVDEGCLVLDGPDIIADAIIDLSMLAAKWDAAAYHLARLALRIMTADPLPKKHTRQALRRALAAIISAVGESRSVVKVDERTSDVLQNAFSVVASEKI